MAYPRPAYDNRSPTETEQTRTQWDPIPRHSYYAMPSVSPSYPVTTAPNLLEPESEDSDVSLTPGDPITSSPHPQNLPPPPAQHALETPDALQAHLNELSRVEDQNIRKHKRLVEKRARKDDRIRHKRAVQDAKIKSIMDTRARRDARIERRRQREDAAFQRFYDDLEEEETRLRHRLKRLKRGLPVEEQNAAGRSLSSTSMSPPGPAYSTIPPPAKRHQTGPPGHNDSPISSTKPYPLPSNAGPVAAPVQTPGTAPAPSYQFYQSSPAQAPQQQPTYPVPFHPSPAYNHPPPTNTTATPVPQRTAPPPPEAAPFGVNGQQQPSPTNPHPASLPQVSTPNTAPPPRQVSANYDTRPPQPSGFAAINNPTPPQPGFAAINSKMTDTPPTQHIGLARDGALPPLNLPTEYTPSRPHANETTPTSGPGSILPSSNKRTPSTTHPYQMSEAFANRHHHCEKTDSLNRGIWTWYGPGGTQDNPTGPPTQMYLKCNHDGCGRIDWRTVHGLQCHIVKNHEQPKGTIGSLEKALERYGVPVRDIEEIERRDGLGSGGTMADPKNLKLKAKNREASEKRDGSGKGTPDSLRAFGGRPPLLKDDSLGSDSSARTATPIEERRLQGMPTAGFAAVNNTWPGVNTAPDRPSEPKDHEMRDAPPPRTEEVVRTHSSETPPNRTPSFWPRWQAAPEAARPFTQPSQGQFIVASQANTAQATENVADHSSAAPVSVPDSSSITRPSFSTSVQEGDNESGKLEMKLDDQTEPFPVLGAPFQESSKVNEVKQSHDTAMTGIDQHIVTPKTPEAHINQNKENEPVEQSNPSDKDATKEIDEKMPPPPLSTSDGSRSAMQSPEIPSKRISAAGSRRGSRRSSMATSASRSVVDRDTEDDVDGIKDQDREGATDEDDGQTITVGGRNSGDRHRDKDDMDRTRTPSRRLANGRYMRKAK